MREKFYLLKNLVKLLIRYQNTFFENLFILTLLVNNRSAVLEANTNFPFFSAINQQPRVRMTKQVSNSKLKLDLCNCVKTEIIESTAPPQSPHKRRAVFWDILWGRQRAGSDNRVYNTNLIGCASLHNTLNVNAKTLCVWTL